MYITIYDIDDQSKFDGAQTGHSKPVHWDNSEGWDGERGGRGFGMGGHIHTRGWFMSIYGKYFHNNIKLLASN